MRSEGKNYGKVGTKIGCPQGDPCSPQLYSLYTADVPEVLKGKGVKFAGTKIAALTYADDMVLISNCPKELQEMINLFCAYLTDNGLKLNTSKTKIMIFRKGRLDRPTFYAEGEALEEVNEFESPSDLDRSI